MKTDLLLKALFTVSLLTLFASCGPSASVDSKRYVASADQSQIIGGQESNLQYAQEHGIVGIFDIAKGGLCTGSLIGEGLVLTAGHCVNTAQPTKMIIFFGTNFDDILDQVRANKYDNVRAVMKVSRHEKYGAAKENPELSMNDIALVRFKGTIPAGFQLAKMVSVDMGKTLKAGDHVTLSGYGLNEFKADPETGEPIVSKGSGVLRMVENVKVEEVADTHEEILLDQSEGRGACHGDSGGPAYFQNLVIGVTSRGSGNCDEKSVYTDVAGYADWIAEKSKVLMQ